MAFTLGALVAMMAAAWRRERVGGSLGSWDESLALNGLALLAQMFHRLIA
jgi:hypothetical protein